MGERMGRDHEVRALRDFAFEKNLESGRHLIEVGDTVRAIAGEHRGEEFIVVKKNADGLLVRGSEAPKRDEPRFAFPIDERSVVRTDDFTRAWKLALEMHPHTEQELEGIVERAFRQTKHPKRKDPPVKRN